MRSLSEQELNTINGGIAKTIIGGVIVGVVFLASVVYGYIHPNKCN